jgi:ParB/RepB/Spo0J family partition protein
MAETPSTAPVLQLIALGAIYPSPHNPRKRFDEAELNELAESIRAKGVLQPVLVRPRKVSRPVKLTAKITGSEVWRDGFELIAGERRCRAARLAGLTEIPARVLEMDDKDAAEARIIENEQRADVTALEKADGYQHLIDAHGHTTESIAQKVGKSVSTVRGLLRLRQLPEKARAALDAGDIPASTAQLIARVPTEFHRERVAAAVVQGIGWHNPETFNDPKQAIKTYGNGRGDGALSYRETKELIERNCMVELKGARFDRKSLDLVPAAGSCEACPKRVGNLQKDDPEGYEGVRADVCTDPQCFRAKTAAHQQRLREQAEASGKKVLAGAEAKGLFNYGGRLEYNAPYVELEGKCHEDKKTRTYRKLVGKQLKDEVVVAEDPDGNLHSLLPRDRVRKILKAEHGIGVAGNGGSSRQDARWKAQQAKQRAEDLLKKEAARRCMGLVAERASAWSDALLATVRTSHYARGVAMLRLLVAGVVNVVWDDISRAVKVRRGLGEKKPGHAGGNRDVLAEFVETLDGPGLFGLFAELIAGKESLGFNLDKKDDSFWSFFGVDRKAIEKEARAEKGTKAKRKEKRTKAAVASNGHAGNSDAEDDEDPQRAADRTDTSIDDMTEDSPAAITGDTFLIDLLAGKDVNKQGNALQAAGLDTVSNLLARAAKGDRLVRDGQAFRGDTQLVYATLREVKGLPPKAVTEIGDAIVDAGLVGPAEDNAPRGP